MNLTIFGGTGRTGQALVRQALDAGHDVTVFARTPSRLELQHDRLHAAEGDVYNAEQVAQAVSGADAVLSALGHGKSTPPDMQTVAIRHIVDAMRQHDVKRIISLTGAGVRVPGDNPKLFDRIMKVALNLTAGKVLRDAEGHFEVLKNSNREWIVVRVPVLTDGPATGDYKVGMVGSGLSPRISREDVADFMLKQIDDDTYVRQAPMIGG